MHTRQRTVVARVIVWSFACLCALAPRAVWAEPGEDVARLQSEVTRLKQDVQNQRQLILQVMQVEQQHYDMLLKFLNSGGTDGLGMAIPTTASPSGLGLSTSPKTAGSEAKEGRPVPNPRGVATVSGHVGGTGKAVTDAYVYIDGLRTSPARNHQIEIKQRDKDFSPRVSVVPTGTRVIFPNDDSVVHNVFSTNAGNAFDLGSVKSGQRSAPVVLLKPGHVEVFCNIHSKMRADILVVPNGHWSRVGADGSFQISGVPVGARRIVLWSPAFKPIGQDVDVTAKGGSVTFAAEGTAARPHFNKRGQAYGSYDE